MRISDWSSDVCASDLLKAEGDDRGCRPVCFSVLFDCRQSAIKMVGFSKIQRGEKHALGAVPARWPSRLRTARGCPPNCLVLRYLFGCGAHWPGRAAGRGGTADALRPEQQELPVEKL